VADRLVAFLQLVGHMVEVVPEASVPSSEAAPSVALVACIEIVVLPPSERGDTHEAVAGDNAEAGNRHMDLLLPLADALDNLSVKTVVVVVVVRIGPAA